MGARALIQAGLGSAGAVGVTGAAYSSSSSSESLSESSSSSTDSSPSPSVPSSQSSSSSAKSSSSSSSSKSSSSPPSSSESTSSSSSSSSSPSNQRLPSFVKIPPKSPIILSSGAPTGGQGSPVQKLFQHNPDDCRVRPVYYDSRRRIMIIVCSSCQARYKFDESKLGQRPKAKTKCAKCGSAIEIENPMFGAMTLPPSPEPSAPVPTAAPPVPDEDTRKTKTIDPTVRGSSAA